MRICLYLSEIIIPIVVFYIVLYGFFNKTDVYESFLKGVKEGFQIVVDIAPTMIALMVSIGIFRGSGALDMLCRILKPIGNAVGVPSQILPVFLVRMCSSSAALSFVLDIFKEYGPDSYLGFLSSIMMSCTETILYTMTIYYMSVSVKKTRWTFAGAMVATMAGTIASVIIAMLLH